MVSEKLRKKVILAIGDIMAEKGRGASFDEILKKTKLPEKVLEEILLEIS